MDDLKKTPLYDVHVALNGKIVAFGGWALPVQYSSILEEHKAVRERVGIFDVSHMGEIFVKGENAFSFLQNLLTNDITTLKDGACRYSALCYPDGGTVDDVLIYRFNEQKYLVVVNASNTDKDFAWMQENSKGFHVHLVNESPAWVQLALQGPQAEAVLAPLCNAPLPEKNYTFQSQITVSSVPCIVSRTGYTGEEGFELYCKAENGAKLHDILMKAGAAFSILPCGLGARDTLRFEASMPLYGHELSKDISPRECGLDFAVKLNKEAFIGKEALSIAPKRVRIGLKLIDKGIAREHADVLAGGKVIGFTTSGSPCPTLGGNYAMAIVDKAAADEKVFFIKVRDKELQAEVIALPFYRKVK